jgi:hypothetical protein
MPTEDRRRLDKQRGSAPGRREARGQTHREALPWCLPHEAHELSLGHDELLAEQTVLGDERSPTTEQIGGETGQEPNEISHGRSLYRDLDRYPDGICNQDAVPGEPKVGGGALPVEIC